MAKKSCIFVAKENKGMRITSAEFKFSSSKLSQIPRHGQKEFAFIGRSNVGKSSLINMLCGAGLAKVSSTPGKTKLLNHFLINDSWWLVDMPGYGYAKVSRDSRKEFSKIIVDYVTKSEGMHFLFVLIDSRHEPMKIDMEFLMMLGREGIPFGIVFTKSDKMSATRLKRNVEVYSAELLKWWEELPPIFVTSSEKRQGGEEILDYIENCL